MYPVLTFKENGSQVDLAEFQYGSNAGEYYSPYIHTEVTMARLKCKDITDDNLKQQCYLLVSFVTNSQDYFFGVKLSYETNGIKTNVYQEADLYQSIGSRQCSEDSELTTYFFPDGYVIYHKQLIDFPSCAIASDVSYSILTGSILWQQDAYFYTKKYTLSQYSKSQFVYIPQDMTIIFERNYASFPQYIQYNALDEIVGSFYFETKVVKQCIYLVNLMVIDDYTIDLEFRSHYFKECQNFSEDFEFQLISENLDILQQQNLNIQINANTPIQKSRYKLQNNIKKNLKNNPSAQFLVRGASFLYAGNEINYSKDALFLIIQLIYFMIYISIGLASVLILLKRQNGKE